MEESSMGLTAKAQPPMNYQLNEQDKALIMGSICKGYTHAEMIGYVKQCVMRGFHPLAKQIWPVKYSGSVVYQTSIDGYRNLAHRTGKYRGIAYMKLLVRDKDGDKHYIDHNQYDPEEFPQIISGTVGIWKTDRDTPEERTAIFKSYAKKRDGRLTSFWADSGDLMILKCAEALVLRSSYGETLSGLYTQEEMDHLDPDSAIDVQFSPAPVQPQVETKPSPTRKTSTKTRVEPTPPVEPAAPVEKYPASQTLLNKVLNHYANKLGYKENIGDVEKTILKHYEVQSGDDIKDTVALRLYCAHELPEDLAEASIIPMAEVA